MMVAMPLDSKNLRSRGYELEPLLPARLPVALDMLQRSYPDTPMSWWNAGMKRLQAVPPNTEQRPIGMLMHGPRGVAGVTLLFDSARGETGTRHINASSWAIDPADRMQALWMAKQTLCDPQTVYTALTPIPQALRILQRLGFKAASSQRVLVMTPLQAQRNALALRVLDATETLQEFRNSHLAQALLDHVQLGCIVCAIEFPDRLVPLILRTRRQSRLIPLAEIIYTPSVTDVVSGVGVPPRHNSCRLLRNQEHGDGDEGHQWHVTDNHSRIGQ